MPEMFKDSSDPGSNRSAPEPRWFAAYTASHHEKQVFEHLTDRHVESFLPLYKASRRWKKRAPVTLDLPLFPNYVFVRISRTQRTAVLATPGVYSLVGSAQQAWELPARDIDTLRAGILQRNVEPHAYLAAGERARIKSGLLEGLEGVIVRQKNNLQFVLSLDQIMQSIAIEVEADELEPLSRKQVRHPRLAIPNLCCQPMAG